MELFIQKHCDVVTGVLSGFDRLVLRGTLRSLAVTAGMMDFLYRMSVLLKQFGAFAEQTTQCLKEASLQAARRLDRPIVYLPSSQTRKETIARQIAQDDSITEGLICVLTCVEPCMSYELFRDRERKKLVLQPRQRKCLHLYHYWIDPVFGFMHGRIASWFPFSIQVCLNGREWLARQMDRVGIRYERRDNCFVRIEQVNEAQQLMETMLRLSWPSVLRTIACRLNPAHGQIFGRYKVDYYWSVHQSEWATDVMFDSPSSLARIYPPLVRGAIGSFSSPDVMRFLGGKKLTGTFAGQVVSDYKKRTEGVRVKHRVKANSIKVYDKHGSILRVETTINDPRDFKVFRPLEGQPDGPLAWRVMRKGVADLHRRAEVSQAANDRYLDALASLATDRPLGQIVEPICRRIRWKGRSVRALRPWSRPDRDLLEAINQGQFVLNGFRNRDLVAVLFGRSARSPRAKRQLGARVSRMIRMLRAHRLIRKVPGTYRYRITSRGRQIVTAIIEYQHLTLEQLTANAA